MVYAFLDGDNIGKTLEILLREERITEAVQLSQNIILSLQEIESFIRSVTGVTILIIGGDDILLEIAPGVTLSSVIDEVRRIFVVNTDHSMSCGVGPNIPSAVQSLYLAKLYGKNRLVEAS